VKVAALAAALCVLSAGARAETVSDLRDRLLREGDVYGFRCGPPRALLVVQKGYLTMAELRAFGAELNEGVSGIPALVGRQPSPRRFTVFVFGETPDAPMSQVNDLGEYPGEKAVFLRFVKEGSSPLFHELTHLLVPGSDGSQSLSEGFASWAQARFRPGKAVSFTPANADPNRLARQAVEMYPRAFYETIGANEVPSWSSQEIRHAFYHASWSFVDYLIALKGLPAFLAVYDASGTDASYRSAYGRGLSALRDDWRARLPPK
jgi:hypothetical protein